MYKYLYLSLAVIILAGCQRVVDCKDGTLKLDLTAIDKADRDTVLIKVFENDVQLSSDTSRLNSANEYEAVYTYASGDNTPDHLSGVNGYTGKTIDIILTSTGKTYHLSDFRSYPTSKKFSNGRKVEYFCFNTQLGLSLDGVPKVLQGDNSYTLKLDK